MWAAVRISAVWCAFETMLSTTADEGEQGLK